MWTKIGNFWFLKDYPFFNTIVEDQQPYRYSEWYVRSQESYFRSIDLAKKSVIDQLKKLKPIEKIDPNDRRIDIGLNVSGWPNNIQGTYISDFRKGLKYKWITGMHQPWRCPSNEYAIRYDWNVPNEELERIAIKLINRHINRFKREIS